MTGTGENLVDPAADGRADYDYAGGSVSRPGLVRDLDRLVDGAVRCDEYTRQLYATDASAYEVLPVGVVFPTSTADVAAVVSYCARREIPVLPRGGGTSLAGQSVNEAVVLDFTRHMDDLLGVDPDGRTATAQPGVVLGELNAALADHGLKFAPDPAWGDKSALGGAIGNNSTGSHSLVYGKTDAYVEEAEVVLADGTVTRLGEVTLAELRDRADPEGDLEARIHAAVARIVDEEAAAVRERYPDLKRNVSGYNLDRLVDEATTPEDGGEATVNLARLLAGSEGTLAVVTEATVSLEPVPETKAVALLCYEDLTTAMEDVAAVLDHGPAAVEVLDDVLLDLARDTEEFGDLVRSVLPEGTGSVLLVEFYAGSDADGRQQVADLLADRVGERSEPTEGASGEAASRVGERSEPTGGASGEAGAAPVRAFAAREAHDEAERTRFWKLRKSGLPILLGRTSDAKHISFIEDAAVPPEQLPAFVADFREVLDDHGTFASFYGHAGPGCLHVRPLVNTKTVEGIEQMRGIAEDVSSLAVEYGGSVSGEHGDGRARTQWNRKLYGGHLWNVFRDLKTAFDPDWILNPGQVCGDVDLTENLRYDPDYEFDAGFEPTLTWDNENGFEGMAELCHGCGGCRGSQDVTGGVMCPTYRAADEEIQSTRGRANLLRQAMSGDLPVDPTDEEFREEVLDLCIGCKGCSKDCPSEVDMAKLKAEVEHAAHQESGAGLRDRLFRDVDRLSAAGSALAPLSNLLPRLPGARWLLERTVGIASERSLPTFARTSFQAWFDDREPAVSEAEADRRALLVPDTYTNYSAPEVGRAAVAVLEAANVHVQVAETTASGRAAHSKGFLDVARQRARANVDALAPHVEAGWDVVVVEPTDAVMFQSDYRDLLDGPAVRSVATGTYGLCEYLVAHDLLGDLATDAAGERLTYHGHCHQKATGKDGHAVRALERAGYAVDALDSTCCGMAGSFGYEAEHYSMSRAVGSMLFDQVSDSPGETVVAPGASCRTQLGDRPGADERPAHPAELLADAIDAGSSGADAAHTAPHR
ncbi:MAG: FAD-binding and (Fe-S)-binding domain-containing protein [Haloarculaceae archaeon]